jgi:F1F0 ATPase subunit 2
VTVVGALAAVALGLALGGAYFGGLWWTLARLPRWRRPGWALAASFAVRGPLLLVALALLARQGVVPLLLALAGFLVARVALSAWLKAAGEPAPSAAPRPNPERDAAGGAP